MDKKTALALASGVVIVAAAAAIYYFTASDKSDQPPVETAELPTYGTDNPLEKKPDLNPVEKTNPFADIKTNPFE